MELTAVSLGRSTLCGSRGSGGVDVWDSLWVTRLQRGITVPFCCEDEYFQTSKGTRRLLADV